MSQRGFLFFVIVALLALTAACSRPVPEPEPDPQSRTEAPAIDCRRDITADECDQAQAALAQDATALAAGPTASPISSEQRQSDDVKVAAITTGECQLHQQSLAALKRMERGEGDILTDDERAQLPTEIQRVQAYLDTNCK